MYIQLSEKCNMSCEHCCFACTSEGEDMSRETFHKAIKLASDYDEYIMLGGGEPTLHPLFEEFLGYAIVHCSNNEQNIGIITNGSIREHALTIARLVKNKIIWGELSQDSFHDNIDYDVVKEFTRLNAIRNVEKNGDPKILAGRNLDRYVEDESYYEKCACDNIFVKPSGNIHQCGCKDSPIIGNVYSGYKTDNYICCYKDL